MYQMDLIELINSPGLKNHGDNGSYSTPGQLVLLHIQESFKKIFYPKLSYEQVIFASLLKDIMFILCRI